MLSSELAKIYERENQTNNTNARKAISRARSPIQRNKFIPFQNNQFFIYLEKQFISEEYLEKLFQSISTHSKVINAIIKALESQGGMLSAEILPTYSISPIENLKGHKKCADLIENLIKAGILNNYDDKYIYLTERYFVVEKFSYIKAMEIAKNMILNDFNDLLRKTNLISYNKGKIWSTFAKMKWGFTAPSYLQGIHIWKKKEKKKEPGFILADIVLNKEADVEEILFFIEKINIVKSFQNINFVPVLIVYGLKAEALELLKKCNVGIAFIDKVFGNVYKELLDDLINVIKNATQVILNDSEKVDKVFNALINIEGRYNNIIGDMFELMVADFYRILGCNYLEINKVISASKTYSGRPKEIDVLVDKDGKIIIIECKATKSSIGEDIVAKWLSEKIKDINQFLTSIYPNRNFEYQFWSVGGFSEEAERILKEAKNKTRKYEINYFDKNEMKKYATKYQAKKFLERIYKHFN